MKARDVDRIVDALLAIRRGQESEDDAQDAYDEQCKQTKTLAAIHDGQREQTALLRALVEQAMPESEPTVDLAAEFQAIADADSVAAPADEYDLATLPGWPRVLGEGQVAVDREDLSLALGYIPNPYGSRACHRLRAALNAHNMEADDARD